MSTSKVVADIQRQHYWEQAYYLGKLLLAGDTPNLRNKWNIVPLAGESVFEETEVTSSRYYGVEAATSERSLASKIWRMTPAGAITAPVLDSMAQKKSQQITAAKWRDSSESRMLVTSHRLLLEQTQGSWGHYAYEYLQSFEADLNSWTAILHFQNVEPLQLQGFGVPSAVIAIIWKTQGIEGLANNPILEPLQLTV